MNEDSGTLRYRAIKKEDVFHLAVGGEQWKNIYSLKLMLYQVSIQHNIKLSPFSGS